MDSSSASSNTASTTNTTEASSSSASTSVPSSSSTPSSSRMVPANSRDDRLRYSPRTERTVADELGSPPLPNFSLNSFEQLREILQTSSRATLNELGPLPSAMNTLNDLSRQKEFVASMERYVQSSRGYLDRVRNKYKELWVKHRVCKIKLEMQEARIKRMVKETSDLQRLSDDQNCILCLEERRCMVYTTCGHFNICETCHIKLLDIFDFRCPLCRTEGNVIRVHYN